MPVFLPISCQPYVPSLHEKGTICHLVAVSILTPKLTQFQEKKLKQHMGDAEYYFGNDSVVQQWLNRLDKLL
jgi:hypothetical protein